LNGLSVDLIIALAAYLVILFNVFGTEMEAVFVVTGLSALCRS